MILGKEVLGTNQFKDEYFEVVAEDSLEERFERVLEKFPKDIVGKALAENQKKRKVKYAEH